jgi:hypothetical protein
MHVGVINSGKFMSVRIVVPQEFPIENL